MNGYITILLYIGLAELARRVCLSLICAFTGPLSRIPGPFINKLTQLPWMIQNVTGNHIHPPVEYFKKYGDVVRVAPREVLVAGKSGVQKILIDDDMIKSPIYDMVRPEGYITTLMSERDKTAYKKKRRLLSPGFSISYLNGLEPLMQECMQVFEESINAECAKAGGSAIIDILHVLGNLTSDVMSATSFGGSMNLVVTNDKKLRNLFWGRLSRLTIDTQLPFVKYLPFVPPAQLAEMDKMIDDIIAKRRAEGPKKKDLVQIFIETQDADPEAFTQKHLREEMVLFMIAGSDTTSITATFTLLLLVNNPKILRKLEAELETAFPSKSDPVTFQKTQDLPYLNAVINESMRVLPIVIGGLGRYTTQTTMLCGYEVPPETVVTAWVSAVMKDPRIWPDPEDFIPERWLGEYKGVEADRRAYYPFSAGTRNCIGQQFALKELRLILATLVRKYELTLVPGQSHKLKVFTVPKFVQGFYNIGVKPKA